jgi:WD40 repeat protein
MAPLGDNLLLAGQTRGADGRLGRFGPGTDGRLRLTQTWSTAFPRSNETVWAPRLLAVTSRTPDGPRDLAAVVLLRGRLTGPRGQETLTDKIYELRLVRLEGNRFGETAARVDLWSGEGRFQPTLAVSPQGTLAVGGNEQQTIQLFDIGQLLNQTGMIQELRGAGVPVARVEFAARGDAMGLRLEPRPDDPAARATPLLLDIAARKLQPWPADGPWRTVSPPLGEWRLQLASPRPGSRTSEGPQVVLQRGTNVWRRITLEPGREITAAALTEAHDPPLLAVASRGEDEVQLAIYDAWEGNLVRQCTAHTLPIHSLQFSPDARLLASAGDDGIACLWSLVDLKTDTLGKRGAPGLELQLGSGGQLQVRAASAELRDFRAGDVIEGGILDEQFQPWEKLGDAYEAAWRRSPGESLLVRRRRGDSSADVPLPIVQGTDERKPLFSIFVARDLQQDVAGMAAWSWIAFSPLGPFDSSNSDAEQFLGWHINTGNPHLPTSFARADQYREQYRQEGLMVRLWEQGRLAQQEVVEPLPRPTLGLFFPDQEESFEPAAGTVLTLRQIPESIQLSVFGLASRQIDHVTLSVDDEEIGRFEELFDHQWSAPLAQLDWTTGPRRLRASLVTNEPVPQTFHAHLEAVYFPPAPRIATDVPSSRLTADEQLDLEFRVAPAKQDEEVQWSLIHRHGDDVTTIAEGRAAGEATIQRTVLQRPGANRFELVVSNSGTDPQTSPLETTRRRFSTTFQPEIVAPSLITIQHVELLDEFGRTSRLETEPGSLIATADSRLKLFGQVVASRRPQRGTWSIGEQQGPLTLHPAEDQETDTLGKRPSPSSCHRASRPSASPSY